MVLFQFIPRETWQQQQQQKAWAPFTIFSSAVLHIMQQELRRLKK